MTDPELFRFQDLIGVEGGLLTTHPPEVCAGEVCCVHNPTDHHMFTWPQVWRSEFHRMDRRCPHGLPHPDPDGLAYIRRVWKDSANLRAVHTCDGCCIEDPADES